MTRHRTLFADPRHGQILALSLLIGLGHLAYGFEMPLWRPLTAVAAAVATQAGIARCLGVPFDARSALITAGSLTLLLRTDGPVLVCAAATLAIASKALLRVDGRHIVNPAAFGIVATVTLFGGAWVSPGQWGAAGLAVLCATAAGLAVTYGARRLEVPLGFLAASGLLAFGRALWLGDPLAIPLHQIGSGALVVFAFFMISDPMTAPWHRGARVLWVGLVAALGFTLQTLWIVDAGPLFALVLTAPLVPILNRLSPAPRPSWRQTPDQGDRQCAPS